MVVVVVLVGGGGGGGGGKTVVAGPVPWVAVVAWVAGVVCDPALAGALLLPPQPAASAAVRTRMRRARVTGAA
jgi:hypothetical protein